MRQIRVVIVAMGLVVSQVPFVAAQAQSIGSIDAQNAAVQAQTLAGILLSANQANYFNDVARCQIVARGGKVPGDVGNCAALSVPPPAPTFVAPALPPTSPPAASAQSMAANQDQNALIQAQTLAGVQAGAKQANYFNDLARCQIVAAGGKVPGDVGNCAALSKP